MQAFDNWWATYRFCIYGVCKIECKRWTDGIYNCCHDSTWNHKRIDIIRSRENRHSSQCRSINVAARIWTHTSTRLPYVLRWLFLGLSTKTTELWIMCASAMALLAPNWMHTWSVIYSTRSLDARSRRAQRRLAPHAIQYDLVTRRTERTRPHTDMSTNTKCLTMHRRRFLSLQKSIFCIECAPLQFYWALFFSSAQSVRHSTVYF